MRQAENLHLAEPSPLERTDQLAEWIGLVEETASCDAVLEDHGNESGVCKAACELGVLKSTAY